jgi:hypothetical protein
MPSFAIRPGRISMSGRLRGTGSVAAGFHEGSRSEYLGQYVFSSFGTSVPVPRQEDHGVDLYCTLAERKGQRAWPVAYYSVQIKSKVEPWEFDLPESVQWVVEYPAPLLLCSVLKSEARVRVYQTIVRFGAAAAAELPPRLTLVPGEPGEGRALGFGEGADNYLLGPPILDFEVGELLNDERFELFRKVLGFWVLMDFNNVRRYQMGMRSVSMPPKHTTNQVPLGGSATYSLVYAPPEIRTKAEETASELFTWLARVRERDGDYLGSLLAALMIRHREPVASPRSPADIFMGLRRRTQLETATDTNPADYVFAPFDKLLADLGSKVRPNAPAE